MNAGIFPPITLALDYGTKRVGVAISRGTLAEPLQILENDAVLLENIQKILSEEHAEQIVIGISEKEMAERSRAFAAQLRKTLQVKVELMDETLTSHQVHTKLHHRAQQAGQRQFKGHIDHFAAAEILQDWLDFQDGILES